MTLAFRKWPYLLILVLLPTWLLSQGVAPFPFAVIGDNGCDCEAQKDVAERMIEWHKEKPFDTVLMLGDNIYGEGFFGKYKGGNPKLFEKRFDKYYLPLLNQGVLFFASLGNHDLEADDGKSMIADKKRFHIMSDTGYYAFEPASSPKGLITFFALNSPRLGKKGDPDQIPWLERSLFESKSIWKVAFFHHPMYTADGSHSTDDEVRKALEPVLEKGGVQLVLAGHNHFYVRMKPIDGITHITSGGGGRYLHSVKPGPMTAAVADRYHFLYFEAYSDRLDFWSVSDSGPVLDQGSIPLQTSSE